METRVYSNVTITEKEKGTPITLLGMECHHSCKETLVLKEELFMLQEHFQRDF